MLFLPFLHGWLSILYSFGGPASMAMLNGEESYRKPFTKVS